METLSFETLLFADKGDSIEITFMNIFQFDVPKTVLEKIGRFSVDKNTIFFDAVGVRQKFNALLDAGFLALTNKITGKKTVYVHRNSGIPLIGNIGFGLIDRGTNVIEVRPISGCNIHCVYCSVDEDKRLVDFVVDADYLVEEFKKLVEFKNVRGIEAHIASQGEPMLYADIVRLVAGLKKIPNVSRTTGDRDVAFGSSLNTSGMRQARQKVLDMLANSTTPITTSEYNTSGISDISIISIDTNGTLLTKQKIDALIEAGLNRVNLSINAISDSTAKKIAGVGESYNIAKVLECARYLSKKVELIIAPVFVPGWNDEEIEKIIEFTKSLKNEKFEPKCCIQNFLNYKQGRNPVKQMKFSVFFKKLEELELKHKIKLIVDKSDFNIFKTSSLPKPFKKGDIVKARIICAGRLPDEVLAVANGRTISLTDSKNKAVNKEIVNIKITADKHNLFYGVVI